MCVNKYGRHNKLSKKIIIYGFFKFPVQTPEYPLKRVFFFIVITNKY